MNRWYDWKAREWVSEPEIGAVRVLRSGDAAAVTPSLYVELYKRGFDTRNLVVVDKHLPTAGIKQYPKGTPEYEILRKAKKVKDVKDLKGVLKTPERDLLYQTKDNPLRVKATLDEIPKVAATDYLVPFKDRAQLRIVPVVPRSMIGLKGEISPAEARENVVIEEPVTVPETEPYIPEGLPEPVPETVPLPEGTTVPKVEPVPETTVRTILEPAPETVPEPIPEPTPPEPTPEPTPLEPTPETVARVIPETTPRVPPPPEKPMTSLIRLGAEIVGKEAKLPEGSISWRQGIFWKWIPREDYTTGAAKPRTLPKGVTPIGARFTDLKKPTETIQMIGDPGASVPDVSVDLGVADIFISNQAQTIRYTGKGLKTDVGAGVPGPAQGMTIEGGAEPKGHAYARKVYPASSVSRTDVSKEEPVRGGVREIRGKDRVDISRQTEEMQEDDYSNILGFSDKDADDIFGTGERQQKKPVNRVRTKRRQPRRGRDNPPILGGLRR